MTTETLTLTKKCFASPDVYRKSNRGQVELATVEDVTLARITLQPGWKWSETIRPKVQTEQCPMHHTQCVISGRLKVVMDDGAQMEVGPGDFASIPPGHDAWVVGDEPFVCIDFSPDVRQYAHHGEHQR
jgi:mannose-6-phosphate isomerase-like protein (cupin superfamily)